MEHPSQPHLEPDSIFGSFILDDTFRGSLTLTMPSTLAPIRLDAGRHTVPSRFWYPSEDGRIHCPRAFRRLVAEPPYLVGYCRWDGRSGRMTPPDNHTYDFHVAPIHKNLTRARGSDALSRRREKKNFWTATTPLGQPWPSPGTIYACII
jgi:hypothetical protein